MPGPIADLYRGLLCAAWDLDLPAANSALGAFGALDAQTPPALRQEALSLFDLAAREMLHEGPFDFGQRDLLARLRDRGMTLALDRSAWRIPPAETLFVQRKLGGLYLLCGRLGARLDLRARLGPYRDGPPTR